MDYLYSIILGIIQALTEFLPISSSAHLVIFHDIFKFNLSSNLSFDVALHFGTFLALIIFFFREISKEKYLWKWIILGCIPAGLAGLLLEDIIDFYFRNLMLIAFILLIVSFLFWFVEKSAKQAKSLEHGLNFKNILFIGFAQILALVPGVSRSGITTIAGMQVGLKREAAAKFSFLIALPIFAAASLKKGYDLSKIGLSSHEIVLFLIGAVVSTLVGLVVIKWLLNFFKSHTFNLFICYRVALSLALIIYLTLIK